MLDIRVDLTIVRDLPASIMVLDRDLRFVMASDMYLATVGQRLEDLVGRHVFDAFPEVEERRRPLEVSMRRALAGEGNAIERLAYAIPDPSVPGKFTEAWWRCRHNPVVGPDGSIGHVVQITENVTDLVRSEEKNEAIGLELQHRVGNLFSLVQVIARRTAANAETMSDFLERFDARIQAMARTHAHLIGLNWDRMSIGDVVAGQLQHGHDDLAGQMSIAGPAILLGSAEAQMLSMAIHELTTNSLKYGALKDTAGRLQVSWALLADEGFRFDWVETAPVTAPETGRSGFGSMILDKIVPSQLGGTAERVLGPEGLRYALTVETRTPPA